MTIHSYYPGNNITLTDVITDKETGNPADPTELNLIVLDPLGNSTVYDINDLTHVSPGVYAYSITVDAPGIWHYRFIAKQPFKVSNEKSFIVRPTEVPEPE